MPSGHLLLYHQYPDHPYNPPMQRTPIQLVAQSLTGMLALAVAYAVMVSKHAYAHPAIAFLVLLGIMAACFWVSFNAENDLKKGIAADRWNDARLSSLRNNAPWFTALAICILVAACTLFFLHSTDSGHHAFGYGFPLLFIGQTLTRLAYILKQQTQDPTGPRWTNLSAIRSEHWGNH
jgi:FtsH-binding integral membrane protein